MSEEAIYKLHRYPSGELEEFEYVQELVRCKECRKTKDDFIKGDKLVWCGKWKAVMEVNEFCSRGERKE